ncbi:tyrosine-type recombinase/integrase [Saccharothrix sp. ST-888]|uniref:tyrosine-type recombinase/integrase n=1 Tax=Saccharothrix sp. ST-888 TaxID=1427391 RepID=UPI0005EC572F|nr:site-specific integrase [Saccharothrix sp. ST-888]KJK55429.1 integrase [Saccharothrix sp. ST-888]
MANNSGRRRRWGSVRKLPSGRFQARYPGPDGALRNADETFETKGDAEAWLVETEADIRRGEWRDPNAGAVNFLLYATAWIDERDLAPLTEELYRRLLRLHIAPTFGESDVKDITAPQVRSWRAALRARGIKTTAAKSYRLLKSIMETAVDDELIRRNPCRIKGGGKEKAAERPHATIEQVLQLAELMGPRWQLMVFIAAFMALRPEEQAELRCRDVDLEKGVVWIRRAAPELCTGERAVGDPKTEAGKRALRIPTELLPEFERHLRWYAQEGDDGLLFIGERGAPFRRSTFGRKWRKARAKLGMDGFRFYDLRHTGNVLAASTGASLRDLMAFMGHNSPRAALIYQHATEEQQTKIANGISAAVVDIRTRRRQPTPTGTTSDMPRRA